MCELCYSNGTCVGVLGARRFKVKEWGYLNSSTYGSRLSDAGKLALMRAEIYTRGPIVCSMQTEDDADDHPSGPWHCYSGGVYRTPHTYKTTNHARRAHGPYRTLAPTSAMPLPGVRCST